ncbi:LysR substrate-binding domain-containing protein [Roseovarius salinarum]|uniref:LysR substrate-binding domain-containing protein n=1 Tax=Roseovarius salinarum TaxID=1981892 RepID=UPI0018E488B4|nr:LysR substrate-binding domain-containing protein [Roseovarius salinarum]
MPRRLPPLNQLRAFEAAARHGSFKTGAAELCVTQAAVSHQIKALEAGLGTALFVRRTRAVELTSAGRRLARALTPALDAMETAALEAAGTAMTGELRVSVAPFYGNRFLLPRLPAFHAAHPGLTIAADLSFEQADLAAQGLDAALRYGTGDWPGTESILIHRDRVGPVCAPHALDQSAPPLAAEHIAALPLATTHRWQGEWEDWFRAAGHDPGQIAPVAYDSRALAFDAALSGNAVCLADPRLTGAAERAGQLVRLHPATVQRPQGIHLVRPGGRRPDPRVAAFADWLKQQARDAAPSGPG